MRSLCILGVDDNHVLKDFVRAHVERLDPNTVTVGHWYPDYVHDGRTIRHHYTTQPLRKKLRGLLPAGLHRRLINERSEAYVRDALAAFFEAHDVDVILAEFGSMGAAIAPHAYALGIPLIVHFHGGDAHRLPMVDPLRDDYREMFRTAFRIVSVSRYMTDALVDLGADPDRIVTNPYGPRERFYEIEPDYRPTLLGLGRFTDIKANYLTLMAFQRVAEAHPEARLVLVGGGELLETCRTLADVWGLNDRVDLPGVVPHAEIPPYFGRACGFVQHSVCPSYGDAEGTPVVILEAQAAALPVVSTRHAGIRDAVLDGETGFLVDERDVEGMADAMLRLVRDADLARTMGARARAHIQTDYSLDRHIGCLQDLIAAARAAVPA